jgi:predicted RNA-binding protein with TRAM domain
MEISDTLLCLYSGKIEERGGRYVVEVPEDEVTRGDLDAGGVYRVALLPAGTASDDESTPDQSNDEHGPPVGVGDRRTVDIEDIGEQGDGIARVERGYVVIVPDTEEGERVTIEVTDVRENMGFAKVLDREAYYE